MGNKHPYNKETPDVRWCVVGAFQEANFRRADDFRATSIQVSRGPRGSEHLLGRLLPHHHDHNHRPATPGTVKINGISNEQNLCSIMN